MNGRPNSTICFSGNSVVSGDGAMARRKGVVTTRVTVIAGVIILVGILMAGRIFLTNQITGLRSQVADLESQKEFLEAGSAKLHKKWNLVSSSKIVMARAQKELGLIVPQNPGLVLVCWNTKDQSKSVWSKLKKGVLSADLNTVGLSAEEAMAGAVSDAMVSLEPRGALAGTYDSRVE